jgi:hypothetical protein
MERARSRRAVSCSVRALGHWTGSRAGPLKVHMPVHVSCAGRRSRSLGRRACVGLIRVRQRVKDGARQADERRDQPSDGALRRRARRRRRRTSSRSGVGRRLARLALQAEGQRGAAAGARTPFAHSTRSNGCRSSASASTLRMHLPFIPRPARRRRTIEPSAARSGQSDVSAV